MGFTPSECACSNRDRLRFPVLFSTVCLIALNCVCEADAQVALLEFNQPTNNAVFSNLDEIPILVRGAAIEHDVFAVGELFVDGKKIADLSYCCALCPCAAPQSGQETLLQIPVPWNGTTAPSRPFQGWTNPPVGMHRLTARSTGENGTMVEATPVNVTVFDGSLEVLENGTDGTLTLVIREGSLTPGRFDLEVSNDLRNWTRVGEFGPGNVAAFYFGIPVESNRQARFFRSVYVP